MSHGLQAISVVAASVEDQVPLPQFLQLDFFAKQLTIQIAVDDSSYLVSLADLHRTIWFSHHNGRHSAKIFAFSYS
jgi:hypothetical protein